MLEQLTVKVKTAPAYAGLPLPEYASEAAAGEDRQASLLRDKVTQEEVAKIVERWTGIPVSKLMEGEREKLLHLEDILHRRVVGQEEAVRLVSEAILKKPRWYRRPG